MTVGKFSLIMGRNFPPNAAVISDEVLSSARVLIVDDEPGMVALLERLLRRAGCEHVLGTGDGAEVEDLVTVFQPDLILLDLWLGTTDGLEVLERLKPRLESETYLPVIVTTGDVQPEMRLRAFRAGAKDFLVKPFDGVELMLRIQVQLETRMLVRSLLRRPPYQNSQN